MSTVEVNRNKNRSKNSASAITVIKHDVYTPLKEAMKEKPLNPSDVIEIVKQVTQEMVILLDLGVQHGHINLDTIFVLQTYPWVNIV